MSFCVSKEAELLLELLILSLCRCDSWQAGDTKEKEAHKYYRNCSFSRLNGDAFKQPVNNCHTRNLLTKTTISCMNSILSNVIGYNFNIKKDNEFRHFHKRFVFFTHGMKIYMISIFACELYVASVFRIPTAGTKSWPIKPHIRVVPQFHTSSRAIGFFTGEV